MSFQDFFDAYVECALWSSTDDDGNPMDDSYYVEDLHPECLDDMRAECREFYAAHSDRWSDLDGYNDVSAGHDFWLTRVGHGAGFWDRGLGELGEQLTAAARASGSRDLYVGDDGKVYVS